MTLPTGFRLGRYEVDGLIASGGMGDVYRARDTRLDRVVALKVLGGSVLGDSERLARFTQEARTTALINHPNIVAIYDVGLDNGQPFVVSELLHGRTLRAQMAGAALPVGTALQYTLEVAHGLIAAHHLGVVHRDLKPENVFVTEEGRLKILDFGLAKCRHDALGLPDDGSKSTQPGTILGTVGYMSPEQVRGVPIDERCDIFSLGVILYEMLAGRAPFARETPIETLYAILKDEAAPLAGTPELTDELEHIVRHCLEKEPERTVPVGARSCLRPRVLDADSASAVGAGDAAVRPAALFRGAAQSVVTLLARRELVQHVPQPFVGFAQAPNHAVGVFHHRARDRGVSRRDVGARRVERGPHRRQILGGFSERLAQRFERHLNGGFGRLIHARTLFNTRAGTMVGAHPHGTRAERKNYLRLCATSCRG